MNFVLLTGLAQEVWGQAAASLLQVSLPVKLQLPEQHTLDSCDFDITCKLAFKSKVAVMLRLLKQLKKGNSSSKQTPVQFCLQVGSPMWFDIILFFYCRCVGARHVPGRDVCCAICRCVAHSFCFSVIVCLHGTCAFSMTRFAALVSTDQIADSIRDNGDGSLLRKPSSLSTNAAPVESSTKLTAVVDVSQRALCAPDAHPDATNALLAFIGVPAPSVISTGSESVASPDDVPLPSSPRRPRPNESSRDSADPTKLPFDAHAPKDDFAQCVLPFLQMQQQLQEQQHQCVQDSIFYISVMEAATFLKHVAVLSAFLISCCLVPWRLPAVLHLVFKTNDAIKQFQALNACHLLSLVAAQRPEMIAISVQRMHSFIQCNASENVLKDLHRFAPHVTGCGRAQTLYERMLAQVRSVLKKTDADGYVVVLSLVKAHDESMRLQQLHALYYGRALRDLTIAAMRAATAEEVSAKSRDILHALSRSGPPTSRDVSRFLSRRTPNFGILTATQPVQLKSSEPLPMVMVPFPPGTAVPPLARKLEDSLPVGVVAASGDNVIEPQHSSHTEAVRHEEMHSLDTAGLAADRPLVLDAASLNHIDQQARVATIVAAHFAQSEAEFAAALQKLRDREQQLQVCFVDAWRNMLRLTLHRQTIRRRNGLCRTR